MIDQGVPDATGRRADAVPTFPNTTYLVPRADYDYFRPASADRSRAPRTEEERRRFDGIRLAFGDSLGRVSSWRLPLAAR
jgi:hypothetical protein